MSHAQKIEIVAPRSRHYQGPFGRIAQGLPGWRPEGISDDDLTEYFKEFAAHQMTEEPGKTPSEIRNDETLRTDLDNQFDSDIPAGYTYFGQFVDHDITFDPTALTSRRLDPNGLLNFRTPRLDLDNVYGRGPADQPYLYAGDRDALLTGSIESTERPDLPRIANGTAIIGDMRNDENAIVAQLQLAFLLAHNRLVRKARELGYDQPFEEARRVLQWLYQWVVWHDFVGRITSAAIHEHAFRLENRPGGYGEWVLGYPSVYSWKHQPYMPVEFSVAAYRFGHSMVRNSYQTNVGPEAGFGVFIPIFDTTANPPDDLRGFRGLSERRVVQWDWFLKMSSSSGPFPQHTRKIDTKLANALAFLPENSDEPGSIDNVLAARNLLRGVSYELPSGPELARHFGIEPITLDDGEIPALWYYILKEAESQEGGSRLGSLGSLIVCATFAGLLKGDANSFCNRHPRWHPENEPLLDIEGINQDPGGWSVATIVRLSGLPVDGSSFAEQN
jgi:hypothetical protein